MNKNIRITLITLSSALLFSTMIVFASLSPLSDMGETANQFNSLGMWLSIAMVFIFYIVPTKYDNKKRTFSLVLFLL